jgi:16S rRNA G966 N2-methylase RsmD
MKLDRFLFCYNGNKFNEITKMKKKVKLDINNYNIIAEPFCGIFGFSRCVFDENFKGEIWLNDLDPLLIEALTILKNNPDKIFNIIDEASKKYDELDNKYAKSMRLDKHLNSSHDELIKSYILRCMCGFRGNLLMLNKLKYKLKNYKEKLDDYTLFFKKVKLFNLDYNEFIKLLPNNNKTLIYLDPPYLNSYNMDYNKFCEKTINENIIKDNTIIYIDILKLLKKLKTHIIMTINGNALMKYIYNKYLIYEEDKTYQHKNKNKTTHITISNFLKLV